MRPPTGFDNSETTEATPATRPTRNGVASRVIAKGDIMGLTTLIPRKKKKVEKLSSQMSRSALSMAQTPATGSSIPSLMKAWLMCLVFLAKPTLPLASTIMTPIVSAPK